MAIISYSKKFIFSRSRKTASSTVQAILSRICDPVTDIVMGTFDDGRIIDESGNAGYNWNRFPNPHPHPPLNDIKKYLGDEYWYFKKIGTVRNPFEVVVSRYHWDVAGKGSRTVSIPGFRVWLPNYLNTTAWQDIQTNYVDKSFDIIIRHENFANDLKQLEPLIGRSIDFQDIPYLKSGFRGTEHYSDYYTDELRSATAKFFHRDLEEFGYTFAPKSEFSVTRLCKVITPEDCGWDNINGPCVYRRLDNQYIIYFANHSGTTIKAAYYDPVDLSISDPWDCLRIKNTPCTGHIASPDVYMDTDGQLIMLYHGGFRSGQHTFKAISSDDGLTFKSDDSTIICSFYARRFIFNNKEYIISKNGNIDCNLYRIINGEVKLIGSLIDKCRHTSVYVMNDHLYIFYSKIGDAPEHIRYMKVDSNWNVISSNEIMRPSYDWEGAAHIKVSSQPGKATNVHQLRDPYVFNHLGQLYLLYSYAGESGIAIAQLNLL